MLSPANSFASSSASYTPTLASTQTYTVTEYDVYLEGPQGSVWTNLTFDVSPTETSSADSTYETGGKLFIVPCPGWSCWSTGAKAGLIVGVVFGVLCLLILLFCLRRWHKRKIWVSHGPHGANDHERWHNSRSGWGYHGSPQADLQTGWGLRPYLTPAQAEAALRGGASRPAPTSASGGEAKKEEAKKPERKGARQKLGRGLHARQ